MYNFHNNGIVTTQRTATPVLYLLYGIYDLYLTLNQNQGESFFPFMVMGLVSGIIFVVSAVRFSQTLDSDRWLRILLFMLLITLGGTLFFFGYVELYPLQYAFVLVYAYLAYRYLQGRASRIAVVISLLLCIAFHLQNILLIPSFVFLLAARGSDTRHKLALRIIAVAGLVLLLVYIGSQTNVFGISATDYRNPFIPFLSTEYMEYSLLHPVHLLDILNEHLLLAGIPVLIIAACLVTSFKKIDRRDSYLLFLLLVLFFFEAFLFGGNLGLGIARDWDICASVGIVLALISVVLLRQLYQANTKALAIALSSVALCSAVAWIGINVTEASGVRRYQDLVTYYTPVLEKNIARVSYENLRKYFQNVHMAEAEIQTIRTMLELHPTHADARSGLVLISNQQQLSERTTLEVLRMIDILEGQSDSLLREEVFDKIRLGERGSEMASTLGEFYEEFLVYLYKPGNRIALADALKRSERFIARHPSLPYGYETYAYLQSEQSTDSIAIAYLEKAIIIDTLRSRPQFYLGAALGKLGRRKEAIAHFKRGLELDPYSKWGLVEYGIFLTRQPPAPDEVRYLHELKRFLTTALARPPKSMLSAQEHETERSVFDQLLQRVDRRLAEAL